MKRSSARAVAVAVAVVVSLVGGTARAHELWEPTQVVYSEGSGRCVLNRSGLSGYWADVTTTAKRDLSSTHINPDCDYRYDSGYGGTHVEVEPGLLKVSIRFYKSRSGDQGTFDLCATKSVTNSVRTQSLRWKYDFGALGTPCGDGWYKIRGGSFWYFNGGWRGGWSTMTGPHNLDY